MEQDPDNTEDTSRALVAKGSGTSLTPIAGAGQRLLTRMNTDVLPFTEAEKAVLAKTLRRVGSLEFCEEDYQQLQLWASQREGVSAEDLANYLAGKAVADNVNWLVEGRIKDIRIDDGFWKGWLAEFRVRDLSSVPLLGNLQCNENQLTELDLSKVPLLTKLQCDNNQLTELDLLSVPLLDWLQCDNNQLTELDLSSVPLLGNLQCYNNQLTELDLSRVPLLTWLWCDENQLTELDLTSVPLLAALWCNENQLTELDIRHCLAIEAITCDAAVRIIKNPDQDVEVYRG